MKRMTTVIAGLVLVMLLAGCGAGAEVTPTVDWALDIVPVVSVTGKVLPAVWADASTQAGGTVIEVLVEPGDEVAQGDVLVRLDPAEAELAVRQAEAALEQAEAELALLADEVHRAGGKVSIQLTHCGYFTKNRDVPPAPGREGAVRLPSDLERAASHPPGRERAVPLAPSRLFNAYGALSGIPFSREMNAADREAVASAPPTQGRPRAPCG